MRVYNFSAGPATLPESVLNRAAAEMSDYGGSGIGVMEMSHRSKVYMEIVQRAETLLRELIDIPSNYKVIFMQGGASSQFAMVPINLAAGFQCADYAVTGEFASKAAQEAKKYTNVNVVSSSAEQGYSYVPAIDQFKLSHGAAYLHITTNNTIYGTRYTQLPDTGNVPLVADMSSNILSEVYDVSKFGLIYAGAQKNMGAAGATAVIIRDDLLAREPFAFAPSMYNYAVQAKSASLYNTPATYSIYICMLVFEWLKQFGGVEAIQQQNQCKAKMLYDVIDASELYKGVAELESRSIMNVTFKTSSPDMDEAFVKQAASVGLSGLKGHRSAGGIRASIYNAMPVDGVVKLAEFMKEFEIKNK